MTQIRMPLTQIRIWQSGQQMCQAAELMITFLVQPIKERINQCLLIRQFEICQVVWVRKNVVRNIVRDGVGATVMLPTKSCKRIYSIHINGIYPIYTKYMTLLSSEKFHVNMNMRYTKHTSDINY